jgi:hypothetical protein
VTVVTTRKHTQQKPGLDLSKTRISLWWSYAARGIAADFPEGYGSEGGPPGRLAQIQK